MELFGRFGVHLTLRMTMKGNTMKKLKYTLLMTGMAVSLSTGAFAEGTQHSGAQSGSAEVFSTMEPAAGVSAEAKLSSNAVRDLQQTLDTRGYSPGPIDGILGPRTRDAIREFQQANNLPATGAPTSDTLAQLGVDVQGGLQQNQQQQNQMDTQPSQMDTDAGMERSMEMDSQGGSTSGSGSAY